jgi:uncharacterized repeat protein (TIGR03803 family)
MAPGNIDYRRHLSYGMTYYGGATQKGIIFKVKFDGTGFVKIFEFSTANGTSPSEGLRYDGTYLYGVATTGGTGGFGVVFKIKPDGTGYTKLHEFTGVPDGREPRGYLVSDGVFLYGMTYMGGTNNIGSIYRIKPDGTAYAKLFNFDNTNGSYSSGSLYYYGSLLYGLAEGGLNNGGVLFKSGLAIGIDEINSPENIISIYPNPAHNTFTILLNEESGIGSWELKIYDMTGRMVHEQTIRNQESEIRNLNLSPGVYLVRVEVGEKVRQQKLVVE